MDDAENGEDELDEEEGEDELDEANAQDEDKSDAVGLELSRKRSISQLKKQMSVQSVVRGGIQGNEGVIGEDGGIEKEEESDDPDAGFDAMMRTR